MTHFGPKIVGLEISLDLVPGRKSVNKFGQAVDVDNGVTTDIWDGAFGAAGVDLWIPPTAARVHTIASASAQDGVAGTGMLTIRVWYLPDWTTTETFVDLTMNGGGGVATPATVMINRMEGLTWGAGGLNAGIITATAAVDGTVTSIILAGNNQTQQMIYGVPSIEKFRIQRLAVQVVDSILGGTKRFAGHLFQMIDPATNVATNTAWITKEHIDVVEGNLPWIHDYRDAPKKMDGPCIVKVQGTSDTNNTVVTAFSDGFVITTPT